MNTEQKIEEEIAPPPPRRMKAAPEPETEPAKPGAPAESENIGQMLKKTLPSFATASPPKYEKYNFTTDLQDAILSCGVAFPDKFMPYAQILNTAYFTGVQRISAARGIFAYWRKHSRFPSWDVLADVVYDAIMRTSEEKESKTVLEYIDKLRNMDTGDADYVASKVIGFAKERALYLAVSESATALNEGKLDYDTTRAIILQGVEDSARIGVKAGQLANSIIRTTIEDILTDDGKAPEAIIEGILPVGGLAVLAGRAKSFKTWTALDLMLAGASGGTWLDYPVQQRPVVFVNFELSQKTLKNRLKAIAEEKGIDLTELKDFLFPLTFESVNIHVTGKDGTHENKFTEAVISEIKMAIRKLKVTGALIILDSFYNLAGGINENDASQVKGVYRVIRKLLADTESTGLLIHHFAKGDSSAKMDGERGAGSRVHRQEPNAYLELPPHKEDGVVVLTADLRDYAAIEKKCYRWKYPLLEAAPSLDPTEIKKAGGVTETYTDQEMIEMLVDGPWDQSDWKKEVIDRTGMSPSTFKERKRRLLKQKKVMLCGPKDDQQIGLGTCGRELLPASNADNVKDVAHGEGIKVAGN